MNANQVEKLSNQELRRLFKIVDGEEERRKLRLEALEKFNQYLTLKESDMCSYVPELLTEEERDVYEDVANANFRLGQDYYYYDETPERLQIAAEHFRKALVLKKDAKISLDKIETEVWQNILNIPENAVTVFKMLEKQGDNLQIQKTKVSTKMVDLNEKEDSLQSEIDKLTNDESERKMDLEIERKKFQEERDNLGIICNELEKGQLIIEEVANDTKSEVTWEEHATIPVVASIKELEDKLINLADDIYKNEELIINSQIPPEKEKEESSQSFFGGREDEMDKFLKEISVKDKIGEDEDKMKLIETAIYLQKILEDIATLFYDNDAKSITVVVGATAAGKSTICRWLTDQQMDSTEIVGLIGHFTIQDTDDTDGGATSKTKQPQIKAIKRVDNSVVEYYGDCPGFHDTRGILQQIKNFFYIQHLFENRNIKFLLAIPFASFDVDRGLPVVDAFKNLHSMIKDPEKLIRNNSISLIVTKCPVGGNNLSWIAEKLKNIAETEKNSPISKLMLHVADSKKISFFSRPVEPRDNYQTHPQSIEEMKKLLQILSEVNFLPLEKDDVNFSPSFLEARFLLRQLSDCLKDHMEDLLIPYAKSLKDHVDLIRENFKTRVDELVNKGINHYKPVALMKGLSQEFGDLCGPEIMEKAVARNNKLRLISLSGTALIAAAVGTAITTVAVSIAIPVLLPLTTTLVLSITGAAVFGAGVAAGSAVAGGTTTFGTFWMGKKLWGDFLRKEFIKKEAKRHKQILSNCITQLQILKNCILNNESYFDNNPAILSDFPLSNPLNISEIKKTTQLLQFIGNLQQREHTQSQIDIEIEQIWNKIFQSAIDTILKQFCETENDFYDRKSPLLITEVSLEKICTSFGDLKKLMDEKALSHISEEFVDHVLRNYLEELRVDGPQKLIYPPLEEKKILKLIYYMNLCCCIYTKYNTESFVPNNLPFHITQIWKEKIHNKKEVDRLHKTLSDVLDQVSSISQQPVIFEANGKYVEGKQSPSISRSKLTPIIQENYTNCINEINAFLNLIGEKLFSNDLNDLTKIGTAIRDLELIQNKIHLEFDWYFNDKHLDENNNIRNYEQYAVSHQSIVATSFLNKSLPYLNRKVNGEIVILDVGFRNLKKLKGMCNVIKEKILEFKSNPLAWFSGLGEVDYIAYIESQNLIKDKLVIVYSGSNSVEDWKTNITLSNTVFVDLVVHGGMGRLMGESSITYLSNLTDKIRHYYSTHQKPQKFTIVTTGHSLGGALALLAAYYYKQEHIEILSQELDIAKENIYVKCFSFAAPAIIADEDSKLKIENTLGKNNIFVTWNFHDPVPFLTQKLAFEVGRSFPLFNINNNKFKMVDNSVVGRWGHHNAKRYLHHLKSLVNPAGSHLNAFIALLDDYAYNIRNFYKVGKDVGIFETKQ